MIRILQNTIMPNLVICLTILQFTFFGPRDPPTNHHLTAHIIVIVTASHMIVLVTASRNIINVNIIVNNCYLKLWANHRSYQFTDRNDQIGSDLIIAAILHLIYQFALEGSVARTNNWPEENWARSLSTLLTGINS